MLNCLHGSRDLPVEVSRQQEEDGKLQRRNFHPSASEQAMSSKHAIMTSPNEKYFKKCRKAVNDAGHTKGHYY